MSFLVRTSSRAACEKTYIFSVVLTEFLGLAFEIEEWAEQHIRVIGADGRFIDLPDTFFARSDAKWLEDSTLPQRPLKTWDTGQIELEFKLIDSRIKIIYGNDPNDPDFMVVASRFIRIGIDIFGSAFFMLSRYEEAVNKQRDHHDRFPATASIAYSENFLLRPIVNEYVEILASCLQHLWPRLKLKSQVARMLVSHDVDEPYKFHFAKLQHIAFRVGGDLIKRRSPRLAFDNAVDWTLAKLGYLDLSSDPYNTFEYLMDVSEKHGRKSAFYFIVDHSAGAIDRIYDISDPKIRTLLERIHERGHEIGLHASYNSYRDADRTAYEFRKLRDICEKLSIRQETYGGRQHFLRWQTPLTFHAWDRAGLTYDSTLSFADSPGFRCGCCYEYPVFDVGRRRSLRLRERPLIAMEESVLDAKYLGLDFDHSLDLLLQLKSTCFRFGGDFTLLWHNSRLVKPSERELYESVVV